MINPFLYNVPSLDVHGCDRTIAVALLKEFIDLYSSRTAHKKLILVHGKGMGILKKATYELLAFKGYSAVSMRDIAKRAGLVVGQLTYHYKTKDHLIESVIEDFTNIIIEKLKDYLRLSNNKVDDVKKYVAVMYEEDNATYRVLLDFAAQSLWNEKIKAKMNVFFEKFTSIVKQAYIDDGANSAVASEKAEELVSNMIGKNLIKITSIA